MATDKPNISDFKFGLTNSYAIEALRRWDSYDVLLEALKKITIVSDGHSRFLDFVTVYQIASQAIAKAEGK